MYNHHLFNGTTVPLTCIGTYHSLQWWPSWNQLNWLYYFHVAHDYTTLSLAELQGAQNSGDGELGESEEEQKVPFHFLWYSTHLSFLFIFSFVPAQPQLTGGYRSYCAFFVASGWSDSRCLSQPKISFPIAEIKWVAPNSLHYCSRQWFIIWTPCDAGCVTFICPRPWDVIDVSLLDIETTMLCISQYWWR